MNKNCWPRETWLLECINGTWHPISHAKKYAGSGWTSRAGLEKYLSDYQNNDRANADYEARYKEFFPEKFQDQPPQAKTAD